jgi:hypothetical protein
MHVGVMYPTMVAVGLIVEIISAALCIFLLRFMIKPYMVTREARYIGLPLGFGFLASSFILTAVNFIFLLTREGPLQWVQLFSWLQLFARAFSFAFLAVTYYFSKKTSKNSRVLWDLTYSILIFCLALAFLFVFVLPQSAFSDFSTADVFIRIINLICLSYIVFHTIRKHIQTPDPKTILIPFGYLFLAISQYSLLIGAVNTSDPATIGALTCQLIGLSVILFVSFRAFQVSKRMIK